MNRWSLAGRLTWTVMALLAVLWLGASLLSALTIREEILEVSDSQLANLAQALLPALAPEGRSAEPTTVSPEDGDHLVYQLLDASGAVIARSAEAPEEPLSIPPSPGFANEPEYRVYTLGNADQTFWVQVAEERAERGEAVRESLLALLWPLMLLLILVPIAIRVVIPRLTAPIRRTQAEITARGAANLEPIPELGLPRELTPITDAVNRLLTRLRKMLEAERAFASNSAHELRTPVAAALAQSQVLASELSGPSRERARSIAAELSRLAHIVEKLLQLSRAESGVGLKREPVDLRHLAGSVVDSFSRQTQRQGRIHLAGAADPVLVEGDLDTLGIALENLVDNAFAHGGSSVKVTVTVTANGCVSVADDGRGVEPEQLATLSERFARGATAGAGSGLGLAIVSTITEQVGGTLSLTSPGPGGGFTATMRLRPVAGNAESQEADRTAGGAHSSS